MFFSEKKERDLRTGVDFAYICLTTDMNPEGYRDTFPGFFVFCKLRKRFVHRKRKEKWETYRTTLRKGYAKLKAELEHMKTVERAHVIKQIAEARDKGDLSENAEYDAAKEAQGMLELRIAKLEETLASARVVDASQLDNSKVLILSTVRIRNQQNGKEVTYTLVAQTRPISAREDFGGFPHRERPFGQVGGRGMKSKSGTMHFEVLEITR